MDGIRAKKKAVEIKGHYARMDSFSSSQGASKSNAQ